MPLKVGVGEADDRKTLAQRVCHVCQMDSRRVQRVVFDGAVANGLEILVAESSKQELRPIGRALDFGRLAVVAEERDDVHAGRQGQQALTEQPEQVFIACFDALRLGLIDLADGHEVLQSVVAEDDAPGAAPALEGGHVLPLSEGNANPLSPRSCCQIVARRFTVSPYLTGIPSFTETGDLGFET